MLILVEELRNYKLPCVVCAFMVECCTQIRCSSTEVDWFALSPVANKTSIQTISTTIKLVKVKTIKQSYIYIYCCWLAPFLLPVCFHVYIQHQHWLFACHAESVSIRDSLGADRSTPISLDQAVPANFHLRLAPFPACPQDSTSILVRFAFGFAIFLNLSVFNSDIFWSSDWHILGLCFWHPPEL